MEKADGTALSVTGADFSYGVGKDVDEAESNLRSHKAEREVRGEIARGELRGITIKVEKTGTLNSRISTLQRLPQQPVIKPTQKHSEDKASLDITSVIPSTCKSR